MRRNHIGRGEGALAAYALALIACASATKTGAEESARTKGEKAPRERAAEPSSLGGDPGPATEVDSSPDAKSPGGYVEMRVIGILPIRGRNTLGLVDEDDSVMVPISIGGTEALSISLRLEGESFERPLTHDLLDAIVYRLGGELSHVQIDRVADGVFHASVHLRHKGDVVELDSRSSDAVALALGNDVPIYVATSVVNQAAVTRPELEGVNPPGPGSRDRPPGDKKDGQREQDRDDPDVEEPEDADEQDDATIDARAVPLWCSRA